MQTTFEVAPRTVHLWSIPTVASQSCLTALARTLSSDEVERSKRFRFQHLAERFAIARGSLRMLIGRYLGIDAGEVQFVYNSSGKPALAAGGLNFNLSHSGDFVLFAITKGCEVGVDIEQVRALSDMSQIASRIFCPGEIEDLERLGEEQRLHAFFLGWTRKEAYIKAIGLGLSIETDSFRVTLEPGMPAQLLELPDNLTYCTLHDLSVAPGYTAALAYQDGERAVTQYSLSDPAELVELLT